MGTLAETAIVDYCLLFADQGKQTSIFSFSICSKQTEVCRFLLSVSRKQMEVVVFR
jgi:hypothetical protein